MRMEKYRIVKVEYHSGVRYEAQKRLFGFLWWYNFNDEPMAYQWDFETIEEARKSIEIDKHKVRRSVIEKL